MSGVELPSPDRLVIAFLKAGPVGDLVGDRIGSKTPANAVWPRINVHRSGGPWVIRDWLVGARVQIDALGDVGKDVAAEDIALAVEAEMLSLEGIQGDAVVTNVGQTLGITDFAEPDTGRPRFMQEFIVNAHPA